MTTAQDVRQMKKDIENMRKFQKAFKAKKDLKNKIADKRCIHPKGKIRYVDITEGTFASCRAVYLWVCECGAYVEPIKWKVLEI